MIFLRRTRRERGEQCGPHIAHLLPPVIVPDGVLQDTLEQHRQLFTGFIGVFLCKLEHGILHDVERGLFFMYAEVGLLERTAFDDFQELGQFVTGSQRKLSIG